MPSYRPLASILAFTLGISSSTAHSANPGQSGAVPIEMPGYTIEDIARLNFKKMDESFYQSDIPPFLHQAMYNGDMLHKSATYCTTSFVQLGGHRTSFIDSVFHINQVVNPTTRKALNSITEIDREGAFDQEPRRKYAVVWIHGEKDAYVLSHDEAFLEAFDKRSFLKELEKSGKHCPK